MSFGAVTPRRWTQVLHGCQDSAYAETPIMLDSTELKTVLTTLSQRRTWLLKHLEEQNRTDGAEEEH